ncbi:D-alanyl-D-alanine carboxypeptidase [Desulfobulbus sp.]|uniref:D-alanyl-D-alanine carboxypeptidase/D-alanyl-D-alanine-endopeptidase n=1 Tax=Desulfobulbus sp. TaxID=895 RepID=UPI00286F4187|nr:D-alanyl-D-alanine carboxypeptidase [Desulfobulbus sp.]
MPRWLVCPKSAEAKAVRRAGRGGTTRLLLWLVLLVPLLVMGERQTGIAACRTIADLAPNGAYGLADAQGAITDGCNLDRALVPASVIKIATVSAALAILGPDYRFRTELFVDDRDNLFVKGFGDPSLVSEEVAELAGQLRRQGLRRVQTLYVDTTAFVLERQVPGSEDSDNPYDAPVGALSVNFNAVALTSDKSGRIASGESQTPVLPIMRELGQGRPPGSWRVNVCARGCGDAQARTARYAGELFQAMLAQNGITVAAFGGIRPTPATARLVHAHESGQTLTEISGACLRYSSNFMANLIFLASGAKRFGYPATWEKARLAVHQELASQLGNGAAAAIVQVDGAGLSRDNRVTVRAMLQVLTRFRPHLGLLNQERGVAVKTGTLTGVYNLAGYLPDGRSFVILLNQPANRRADILARLLRPQGTNPAGSGGKAGHYLSRSADKK